VEKLLAAWQSGQIAAVSTAGATVVLEGQFAQAAQNGSNGWAIAPRLSADGHAF